MNDKQPSESQIQNETEPAFIIRRASKRALQIPMKGIGIDEATKAKFEEAMNDPNTVFRVAQEEYQVRMKPGDRATPFRRVKSEWKAWADPPAGVNVMELLFLLLLRLGDAVIKPAAGVLTRKPSAEEEDKFGKAGRPVDQRSNASWARIQPKLRFIQEEA